MFAFAVCLLAGVAIKPERAVRSWEVREGTYAAPDPLGAAAFNFGRLHPLGRWLILSYSIEGAERWPEPYVPDCGPAAWVTARSLFGVPVARGLVHCTGNQVIWV